MLKVSVDAFAFFLEPVLLNRVSRDTAAISAPRWTVARGLISKVKVKF